MMGQTPSTDCNAIRAYVSASLDDELSEIESAIVEAHLVRCSGCRAYAADAAATARVLRETPLQELSFPIALPGRRLAVAQKLQAAAAAAALAIAVGVGWSVGAGTGEGTNQNVRASTSGARAGVQWSVQTELKVLRRASLPKMTRHVRLAL
jgi:predicted anti-sigma-YlaC factor YlaD